MDGRHDADLRTTAEVCPPHDLRPRCHAKIPAVVRTCRIPEEEDIQGRESETSAPDWQGTPLGVGAPRCCDGSPVEHHRPAVPADVSPAAATTRLIGSLPLTLEQAAPEFLPPQCRIRPKISSETDRALPSQRPRHPQTAQHFVDCDLRHITRDTAPPK